MYSACERFSIKPPNVRSNWEDMDAYTQAQILAYDQIRRREESDETQKIVDVKDLDKKDR